MGPVLRSGWPALGLLFSLFLLDFFNRFDDQFGLFRIQFIGRGMSWFVSHLLFLLKLIQRGNVVGNRTPDNIANRARRSKRRFQ